MPAGLRRITQERAHGEPCEAKTSNTPTSLGDHAPLPATTPAWKAKPSFYLVATDDRMIPPAAQRSMAKCAGATIAEAAGSHAIYVSKPKAVVALVEEASKAATAK